jgi:hypothetical protein
VQKNPVLIGFAALSLALAPCARARGDTTLPASIPDVQGARALAMSAYRGFGAGNDAIFFNAASLAALRRYSVETQWLLDRFGDSTAMHTLGVSIVDSQMSDVAGGGAFTRVLAGPWTGNLFDLALATPVAGGLYLGGVLKYLSLDGPSGDEVRAVNVDASAYWRLSRLVSVGVSGYNLISTGHKTLQPRALGVGASIGDDRLFRLAADWQGDFDRQGSLTSAYAVGGEYVVGDSLPLRASYLKDGTRNASYWSVGIGLVGAQGGGLDLSYRQSFDDPTERTFAVTLKLFLFGA